MYKIISTKQVHSLVFNESELNADLPLKNEKPLTEADLHIRQKIQNYEYMADIEQPQQNFTPLEKASIRGFYDHKTDIIHEHEVIPNLFIGDFFSFKQITKDNNNKIDIAIKVTCRKPHFEILKNFEYYDYGENIFDDNTIESWNRLSSQFKPIFNILDQTLKDGKRVLAFCTAGRSRSATTIMAYLMYRFNVTKNQAYGYLKSLRNINVKPVFLAGLQLYEKILKNN